MEENYEFEDDNDTPDEQLEEPVNRRLVIQPHDRAIVDITRMIDDGDIVLKPPYQRNYLWDTSGERRTSKLIESILLNVPIPVVYLAEEEDGTYSVIDGYQRLNTLHRYFNNKFQLIRLETLTEFNKRKYEDLEPKYQRIFKNGTIRTMIILKDSNPDIKYDIFERLNSGSVSVNEQEMRNSIFHGKLNDLIMELRENDDFKICLDLQDRHQDTKGLHNRYLDAEMILRILTMIEYQDKIDEYYKQQMKKFLNKYMQEYRNPTEQKLEEIRNVFETTIKKIRIVFETNAFRKWENGKYEKIINRSIMDCISISFYNIPEDVITSNKEVILKAFQEMSLNSEFIDSITKWTSTKANLQKRLLLWDRHLKHTLGI